MLLVKESVLSLIEKNRHNVGFPTFKLPASTKNRLVTDPLSIILTFSVCNY